jgi:hypothetical protein
MRATGDSQESKLTSDGRSKKTCSRSRLTSRMPEKSHRYVSEASMKDATASATGWPILRLPATRSTNGPAHVHSGFVRRPLEGAGDQDDHPDRDRYAACASAGCCISIAASVAPSGKAPTLRALVTHRFALDRIEEAYDLFANQRDGVIKVAITPA